MLQLQVYHNQGMQRTLYTHSVTLGKQKSYINPVSAPSSDFMTQLINTALMVNLEFRE